MESHICKLFAFFSFVNLHIHDFYSFPISLKSVSFFFNQLYRLCINFLTSSLLLSLFGFFSPRLLNYFKNEIFSSIKFLIFNLNFNACSVKASENMEAQIKFKDSPYFSILIIKWFQIVICFLCKALRYSISCY